MTKRVYIFDVDGTLTPARQPATQEFLTFFEDWAKEHTFYLCSGSDLEKIEEQLPSEILSLSRVFLLVWEMPFTRTVKKFIKEISTHQLVLKSFLNSNLDFLIILLRLETT